MDGVTYELLSTTGTAYYVDEEGATLDLSATTALGDGGFIEVPPGVHQVEFGGTARDCEASFAWEGDGSNQIEVPVRTGYITYGSMKCAAN